MTTDVDSADVLTLLPRRFFFSRAAACPLSSLEAPHPEALAAAAVAAVYPPDAPLKRRNGIISFDVAALKALRGVIDPPLVHVS